MLLNTATNRSKMTLDEVVQAYQEGNFVPFVGSYINAFIEDDSEKCNDLLRDAKVFHGTQDQIHTICDGVTTQTQWGARDFLILNALAFTVSMDPSLEYGYNTGFELYQVDLQDPQQVTQAIQDIEDLVNVFPLHSLPSQHLNKPQKRKKEIYSVQFYLKKVQKGKEQGPTFRRPQTDLSIINLQEEVYGVLTSAHGSAFTAADEQKLLTLKDAINEAKNWESHADTVGGRAQLIHLPTGKRLSIDYHTKTRVQRNNKKQDTLLDYLTDCLGLSDEQAAHVLATSPQAIHQEETVSKNKALHLKTPSPLFLKLHTPTSRIDSATLAQLEAAANYHFQHHPKLQHLVAGTPHLQTATIGDISFSLQNKLKPKPTSRPSITYCLDAYARVMVYGTQLQDHLKVPAMYLSDFNRVTESITSHPLHKLQRLKSKYQEAQDLLTKPTLILTDTKTDNRLCSKLIDLERLRIGNVACSLPLLFVEYNITNPAPYVAYLVRQTQKYAREQRQDAPINFSEVLHDLKLITEPVLIQEISGLDSRKQTPKTQHQRTALLAHLSQVCLN